MNNLTKKIVLIISVFVLLITTLTLNYKLNYTTLHISPLACYSMMGGITPEEFCETKGNDTCLKNSYVYARVDKDGCLILTLTKAAAHEWKNRFWQLEVLQCVLGEEKDIGVTIDYSEDDSNPMKSYFIKYAGICGCEITDDFKKITVKEDGDPMYTPVLLPACLYMQTFETGTCIDSNVEILMLIDNLKGPNHFFYPDDCGESNEDFSLDNLIKYSGQIEENTGAHN